MQPPLPDPVIGNHRWPWWPALAAWVLTWTFMLGLDQKIDLANQALLLVLGAALAAIWSAPWVSLAASSAAVLGFNFVLVPPRGSFTVDLHQHALLLLTLLTVSWIVALLVARLRWHVAQATARALHSERLRQLGEALRARDDPADQALALQDALSEPLVANATLLLQSGPVPVSADDDRGGFTGTVTLDEAAGLRLCVQDGRAMGPGSGRHEDQPAWYLPLRGLHGTQGAALVRLLPGPRPADGLLEHCQALCDQLGAALERGLALQAAALARELAQDQALRNTLLAAIAHDHRTPLATILGASSALLDQGERLSAAQRQRLAATIVDEATQLARLTDNTLQLARLGAVGLQPRLAWESVEELVGTVLRRVRQRDARHRVKARVEPGLPLLRCDAVLMVQLLDNLLDNALKHGGSEAPVEVMARRMGPSVLIAVRDRGPGVPPAQRERIFDAYQRGECAVAPVDGEPLQRPGAGVGLALCRAIARAHGAELVLRPRGHGGSSFELRLGVEALPEGSLREAADGAPP